LPLPAGGCDRRIRSGHDSGKNQAFVRSIDGVINNAGRAYRAPASETSVEEFRSLLEIENESKSLAQGHDLTQRGDFLIWWYFLKLRSLSSADIDQIVCDGGSDLGIDAIQIDEDNYVHFYQFKNPENAESCLPAGEVDKLLSGLRLIFFVPSAVLRSCPLFHLAISRGTSANLRALTAARTARTIKTGRMTRTERAADDADDTLQTVEAKIEENFKSEENLILDPWSQEFDEICQKAVAFANSKAERLRKHKKRVAAAKAKPAELNSRHRQSLAQERHAIRQALRQPNSVSAHRSMLARLEELEKLIRQPLSHPTQRAVVSWYFPR